MKKLSCTALQSSVYLAPDELRHCCKRFFYKGELKGDVQIFPVQKKSSKSFGRLRAKSDANFYRHFLENSI